MEKEKSGRETLFDGFPPVSTTAWEEKIKAGMNEGDYEKRLIWHTPDGYQIKPYYRSEDLEGLDFLDVIPGQFPFIRSSKTENNAWMIRQDLHVIDIETANQDALDIIEKGVNSIGFDLTSLDRLSEADMKALLKELPLQKTPVNFILREQFSDVLHFLHRHVISAGIDPQTIRGSITYDPLGRLASTGNFSRDMFTDISEQIECLEFVKANLPGFRVIHVWGNLFHDAGASVTQVLAFTLAQGNEYLAQLSELGTQPGEILPYMQFQFSIGSSYFMEIAKLRAARLLWSKIIEAWSAEAALKHAMFIHTNTSAWNQTIYDPYVNLLRGTTETMSAVIGGTDSLTVRPYDAAFRLADNFSNRVARNTQVVLKEESYLDKVIDPAAGSYYIEKLTATLIERAWELFLQVEEKGGFHKSLIDGFIQAAVRESAESRMKNLANRKNIMVGINQYPNFQEEMSAEIGDIPIPSKRLPDDQCIIEPLELFRGSRDFENMRLKTENHSGKKPLVFMLTVGNLAMRRARAMFASNFFACAGFQVIDNIGFESPETGAHAAIDAGADIVVFCSSDEEYASLAGRVMPLLKDKCIPVIAGYPKNELDRLKQNGIEHFIHVRSNVLEELKHFQQLLGIKS
jgi:methylmalonyl-CoA mutase